MTDFARFPSRGLPATEQDISFPRHKPRWPLLSIGYRVLRLARLLFGDRAVLRFMLNANWISWRFSYEISMGLFGPSFRNTTYATSEQLLQRWIPIGGSVLDIGCGTGRLCQMASAYAERVLGIDYDPLVIEEAAARNTRPNVEFRLVDVNASLPTERFDLTLLVAVLEHIEDVDKLLTAVRRISSAVIIEVPDFEADCLNLVRRDVGCAWYTDADHVREYIQPVLERHLVRNGWIPREWNRRGGMLLVAAVGGPE